MLGYNTLQGLFFKLRTMTPCALCHLDFDIHISDDDEVQVCGKIGSFVNRKLYYI